MENEIKVVELFAGVGGFRLGLEGWDGKSASSGYSEHFKSHYNVVRSFPYRDGLFGSIFFTFL